MNFLTVSRVLLKVRKGVGQGILSDECVVRWQMNVALTSSSQIGAGPVRSGLARRAASVILASQFLLLWMTLGASGSAPPPTGEESFPADSFPLVDELPQPIERALPDYPESALPTRQRGTVVVLALVGADGRVRSATIARSCPPFDDSALHAARNTIFLPARLDGRPVPLRISMRFEFAPPSSTASPRDTLFMRARQAELDGRYRDAVLLYLRTLRDRDDNCEPIDYELHKKIIGLCRVSLAETGGDSISRTAVTSLAAAESLDVAGAAFDPTGPAILLAARASRAAPWWPAPYLIIARIQSGLGQFGCSARSLRLYLLANPNAPDYRSVTRRIREFESMDRQPRRHGVR